VEALVVRLEGELARVEVDGRRLVAGGGAANAVCLHRARAAGLGGFEFASAIPGTAGGGVRMNAGAFGADWRSVLERALVVSAEASEWREAADLDLSYRHSSLRDDEVVAEVVFRLEPCPEPEIRRRVAALLAERRRASRRTGVPSGASSRTRATSSAQAGCSTPAA
jgi:UDP-N-acetylmuramate dehydrogenase